MPLVVVKYMQVDLGKYMQVDLAKYMQVDLGKYIHVALGHDIQGGRGHGFTPPVYNRGGQHSPGNRGLLQVVLARRLLAAFTHEWLTFLPPSCSSLRGITK